MRILCIPTPHIYICIYAAAYHICFCAHPPHCHTFQPWSPCLQSLQSLTPSAMSSFSPAVLHHHQSSTQSNHMSASQPPSLHSRTADSSSSPAKGSESLHQQSTSCSCHRANKLATAAQPAEQVHADSHARRHTVLPCATVVIQPCRVSYQLS